MKKSLLLLFAVVAAFVGCQNVPGDDTGTDNQQHYVQVERDTLYLGCEGGEETLFISSNNAFWSYTYDENQEWCVVYDNMDGFGNRVLVVEATANDTKANRELSVIVTNGEAADELVIVQLVDDSKPATSISVAEESYMIAKESAPFSVEVEADGEYDIVIPNDGFWLMHEGTEVKDGKRVENFYVTANYSESVRCTTVSLVSLNTTTSFEVRQWGTVDLMVETETKQLLFLEGRDSIRVEAVSAYTATVAEGDWVTIDTEASTEGWVVFDYTANESETESRTAVISVATANTTKNITLTQIPFVQTEMPKNDNWIDDFAATVKEVVSSNGQNSSSNAVSRMYDGNTLSRWYSKYTVETTPELSFTIDASDLDSINYFRYTPVVTADGKNQWGRWGEIDFYYTDEAGVEKKYGSFDFMERGTAQTVEFVPALPNTITKFRVVINSASPYVLSNKEYTKVASAAEIGFYAYNPESFKALDYFTDWSLSQLKEGVTYEQISQIHDPFYRSIAEQMYYGIYDDEFRVCEFKALPCPELDADILRDKEFGIISNVTGMYVAEPNTPQYIFLDDDHGMEIYIRVINYKDPGTSVHPVAISPHEHGTVDYKIQKGRNVIRPSVRGLMYIMAFTRDESYADIPPMKAHFVNSCVNGYLDYTKHTVDDVLRIFTLAPMADEPRFDMMGEHFVLNFEKAGYLANTFNGNPRTNAQGAIDLMEIYDSVTKIQERMMGHVKYKAQGRQRGHRNRMTFLGSYGSTYAYSAMWHTGYSPAITPGVLNPTNLWPKKLKPEALHDGITSRIWGIAHEHAHSTQTALFTWRGMTEVSNNVMCLLTQNFMYGVGKGYTTMRWSKSFDTAMRDFGSRWVEEFDKDGNWYERPFTHMESVNSPCCGSTEGAVDPCTQIFPFYQLFLYFHIIEGNSDFYPDFYEICRTKDIYEKNYPDYNAYQSAIVLEFMKSISEASGYDMSEWANAWGLPGVNYGLGKGTRVNHYGQAYFTTTAEQIAENEKYNSQFPKPRLNPFYIHDLNLDLYRNPQPVTAGTHTADDKGKFTMQGWQNVVAWVLVDPDKTNEKGELGRDVAVLMCNDINGGGSFTYNYRASRYLPKADNDFSDYRYNKEGTGTNRLMADIPVDYDYIKSLQLYAVDAYGTRYPSQSNTK